MRAIVLRPTVTAAGARLANRGSRRSVRNPCAAASTKFMKRKPRAAKANSQCSDIHVKDRSAKSEQESNSVAQTKAFDNVLLGTIIQ